MHMEGEPLTRGMASELAAKVYALVRACPAGRVTTYGWLGAAVGYPRGARMVGWIMNHTPSRAEVPAHRVINSKGELTGSWAFGQRGRMRQLLEREGVTFADDGHVDLARFGWNPTRDLDAAERERILTEASAAPEQVDDELFRQLLDDPASPFRIKPAGGQ
jgi:methylated-DNA-protein-cysteine methyltransferase-like protein